MEFRVRVVTRASRNELAGLRDGALVVRITTPPVDGKANVAVRKLIAKTVGVGATSVEIVRGTSSREKTLRITGVDEPAARAALGLDD